MELVLTTESNNLQFGYKYNLMLVANEYTDCLRSNSKTKIAQKEIDFLGYSFQPRVTSSRKTKG